MVVYFANAPGYVGKMYIIIRVFYQQNLFHYIFFTPDYAIQHNSEVCINQCEVVLVCLEYSHHVWPGFYEYIVTKLQT